MKKHLALTGFMGTGKSSYGKAMSVKSGLPFIDLDTYIEEQEKKSISELFEKGEKIFREIEAHYLREVIEKNARIILALGGGTVCYRDNLKYVLENCWLIAIDTPVDILTERLWKEKDTRPMIKNINSREELKNYIEKKLHERMSYYSQADWVLKNK